VNVAVPVAVLVEPVNVAVAVAVHGLVVVPCDLSP
jgi:hypothetical protein